MQGLSPVAASGDHSSSRCAGLSLSWPLPLWSTGSRRAGSVVVAHGLSCSAACGILPDQGSNPCPLHWQTDSQPLRHQGSPSNYLFICLYTICLYYDLKIFQALSPLGSIRSPLLKLLCPDSLIFLFHSCCSLDLQQSCHPRASLYFFPWLGVLFVCLPLFWFMPSFCWSIYLRNFFFFLIN